MNRAGGQIALIVGIVAAVVIFYIASALMGRRDARKTAADTQ